MYIRIYYDKIIEETDDEYLILVNNRNIWLAKKWISNQKNHLSKPLPSSGEKENEIDIPYFDIPEWLAVSEGLR